MVYIPSLTHSIAAILGDAQSQNPLLLADAYSSGGSLNLYIDKLGRVRGVEGWTKKNNAAVPTNTGNSAAMLRSLFMYRKIAAGSTTRQLLIALDDQTDEFELYHSTDLGVNWTFIVDLGAGSANSIPDWAVIGDELFFTNGVVVPRMWNGSSLTTAGATQLAAPTLADAGAGNLNGAGYKYRVVPIKANKTRKPASAASSALQVQNKRITVSWTADADVDVIGYEVWRTTGSSLDFYLVTFVSGRLTVSYVGDTLPDSELITRPAMSVVAAHGDPPPTGAYFCKAWKGRMLWGRTDSAPRKWFISDPGDPDSVYQDRSYVDCTDAASLGDVSTGGTPDFEGMFVIWCEKSVWFLSGTGVLINQILDWRLRRQSARTGTVHHRTVVRVPDGAVYTDQNGTVQRTRGSHLAYLTPEKDIRLLNGDGDDTIISFPKTTTLARLNPSHWRKAYAYDDSTHGMFVWVFPVDNGTEPSIAVAWNYWYGTWHEWDAHNFGHVCQAESATAANLLLAGEARTATGAFIYQLWNGDSRNGDNITYTLMTKPIYPPVFPGGLPDVMQEKRMEAAYLMFEKDASPTTITL
ncbi:MAG TPA: hypothetical protein VEI97_10375, partial [bacterium]|nr:hypothetical protein [bacterium]